MYDSAASGHHDQHSLVPAAPQIALLSAIATPVPFAGNLYGSGGTGNASNELRLIIVSHSAGNKLGGYGDGESIDGVAGGKTYFTGDRDISLFAPNDGSNYKFAFTSNSEALIAMRTQLVLERHYHALKLAYLLCRLVVPAYGRVGTPCGTILRKSY